MIRLNENISLDENFIKFDFIRASGPGGQNVNKVATAVQLRFDLRNCRDLDDEVKARLMRLAGKKVTEEGVLIISARRFRTQEKNRQDALERLAMLIEKALVVPKIRRPRTRLTSAAKATRREEKRRIREKKSSRRFRPDPES